MEVQQDNNINQTSSQEVVSDKQEQNSHLWKKGQSGNPAGRPKGKTLKEYARDYLLLKTDEEKKEYLRILEEKKPGFAWQMAEGMPHQTTDVTSGNKPIPLLHVLHDNNSSKEDSETSKEN